MTISLVPEDTRRRRFTCTGGETVFNITFPVFAAADVQVVRLRGQVTTTLSQPADYTVAGAGGPSGFTVTLTSPALAGDLIVVLSAQPVSRTSEWTDGQALRAAALNAEFARWWIALQQATRDVDRAVRVPATDASPSGELPPASERAGRLLGFDPVTGAPVAVTPNPGNLVISAQGEALIAAATPDAARGVIDAASPADVATRVAKSGDTMTGALTLPGAPTATNHAATKSYVDSGDGSRVAKSGDTMTGFLTLHADPTAAMHATTKQYTDARAWAESGNLSAMGAAVGVTGIPNGVREIIINFNVISTNGTQAVLVQTGNSSGYVQSGYVSSSMRAGGTAVVCAGSSSGFLLNTNSASATMSGFVHLTRFSPSASNTWQAMGMVTFDTAGALLTTTGYVSMPTGPLDRVRIACLGSDTFDSGAFNVMWRS